MGRYLGESNCFEEPLLRCSFIDALGHPYLTAIGGGGVGSDEEGMVPGVCVCVCVCSMCVCVCVCSVCVYVCVCSMCVYVFSVCMYARACAVCVCVCVCVRACV